MPKFSGPRLSSGRYYSKRRAGRKPGGKNKPKAKRGGLNKTERKQTKAIAKKVVNQMAESKYFHVATIDRDLSAAAWKTAAGVTSEVGVFGYTTGINRNTNSNFPLQQVIYKYGVSQVSGAEIDMRSLDMNKVFTDQNVTPQRASYSVEGSTVRPSYNECQWLLDRVQGNVTGNPDNALTYKVRMIRVVPRALKGTFQQIDPKQDLFLDQFNEPFGIQTVNAAGAQVFGHYECLMAKVNSRRYRCIADKIITIQPSNLATIMGTFTVPEVNDPLRQFKTTHKLGKEFYYSEPNEPAGADINQYPDTGFQNEFILFHVIAVGNPTVDVNDRFTPGLLNISARPVSTFKDV